ncbi:MAG: hypothetical protein J4G04_06410 [Nitrosopumilaceae archaeon]|nr:hypothetical protein [Nitrosopumilaceae archaeon]
MALSVSYVMAGVSLALLLIYGADVAAGGGAGGDGFIPLDSMIRGMAFGTPPIILSVAAFFVSRREQSAPLGGMILATGILIVVGGSMSLAMMSENAARAAGEGGALLGIGVGIAVLGGIKIWKSVSG